MIYLSHSYNAAGSLHSHSMRITTDRDYIPSVGTITKYHRGHVPSETGEKGYEGSGR